MASMAADSPKERLRKYQAPAPDSSEAPNAATITERLSRTLPAESIRDSSSNIDRPEALPLAP